MSMFDTCMKAAKLNRLIMCIFDEVEGNTTRPKKMSAVKPNGPIKQTGYSIIFQMLSHQHCRPNWYRKDLYWGVEGRHACIPQADPCRDQPFRLENDVNTSRVHCWSMRLESVLSSFLAAVTSALASSLTLVFSISPISSVARRTFTYDKQPCIDRFGFGRGKRGKGRGRRIEGGREGKEEGEGERGMWCLIFLFGVVHKISKLATGISLALGVCLLFLVPL